MTDTTQPTIHSTQYASGRTGIPSIDRDHNSHQTEEHVPTTQVVVDSKQGVPATATNDEKHLTGARLYTLLVALAFITLMIALDVSILATALPRITDDFHTIANVGWYGSAYLLTNSSVQPLTGKVYTFFSLKTSFLVFVVVFELGSALCAASNSSMMLIVGRAIAGLGGAGLASGSLTLIAIAAPPYQRPTIFGIVMSMYGIGQLAGPLIGGALTQHASWRWCFWINLPIGVASAFGILAIRLPLQDAKPNLTRANFLQNFDIVGFLFFAPASIMLLLALQWAGVEYAWSSATTIGLLTGSGVMYIIFAMWEYHQGDYAMFPTSILRQRAIHFSLVAAFLFFGALLILGYYLPLWFQIVKHASPIDSAVYTLPTFLSQVLFAVLSGPFSSRIGFFSPLMISGAAVTSIGAGLMSTFNPATTTGQWIGYQILEGAGRGIAFQQPINTIQAVLTKAQLSTGLSIAVWAQFFGGAVFLALSQTAFSSFLKEGLRAYAPEVDPTIIIHVGATDYVNIVPASSAHGVLIAYNQAITRTYWVPAAVTAAVTFIAIGMGWERVIPRRKKEEEAGKKEEMVEKAEMRSKGSTSDV